MAEIRNLTRNGETFYPLTHVEGVINRDGEPLGIVNDIFDISEYNASGTPPTLATYSSLDLALAAVPQSKQKGGMTIRYVQSSDNKYVQYRLMTSTWSSAVGNWEQMVEVVKLQGVTAEETKDSSDDNNGFVVLKSGYLLAVSQSVYQRVSYRKIDVEGIKRVRFLGIVQESGNSGNAGIAFYDETANPSVSSNTGFISGVGYEVGTGPSKSTKEYIVSVPVGAKYLYVLSKFYETNLTDDFYCYLQTGYPAASTFNTGEFVGDVELDEEVAFDDNIPKNRAVAVKLQNITAEETKDETENIPDYIPVATTGRLYNIPGTAYRKIDVEGIKRIRVLGVILESTSTGSSGFSFYDATAAPTITENTGFIKGIPYEKGTSPTKSVKEYILDVPVGAKYLYVTSKFPDGYYLSTFNKDFYCYLQTGLLPATEEVYKDISIIKNGEKKYDYDDVATIHTGETATVDWPSGYQEDKNTIRVLINVKPGVYVRASMPLGLGVAAGIYTNRQWAIAAGVTSYLIQDLTNASFVHKVNESRIYKSGVLCLSLRKKDYSNFTEEEYNTYLTALDFTVSEYGLESVTDDLHNLNKKSLFLGTLVNKTVEPSKLSINDDEQRVSMQSLIAVPFNGVKLQVKIKEGYSFAIACGSKGYSLDHDMKWYNNGDVVSVPSDSIYYRAYFGKNIVATTVEDESQGFPNYVILKSGYLYYVLNAEYKKIDVYGAKRVRFLGIVQESGNSGNVGVAFYNAQADPTVNSRTGFISGVGYEVGTVSTKSTKEYIIDVPLGAKYLYVMSVFPPMPTFADDFYCYVEGYTGDNLTVREIDNLINTGQIEISYTEDFDVIKDNRESEKDAKAMLRYFFKTNEGDSPLTLNGTLPNIPTFAHTSDIHGDAKRYSQFLDYCDYIGVDAALISGDFAARYPSNSCQFINDIADEHKTAVLPCTGNHDCFGLKTAQEQNEQVVGYLMNKNNVTVNPDEGDYPTYFYKDFASRKIRVISLNVHEGERTEHRCNMTQEQCEWFISVLSGTPENYGVLVMFHEPEKETIKDDEHSDFFQKVYNHSFVYQYGINNQPISKIIDAFISKVSTSLTYTVQPILSGTVETITVNMDFTQLNSGVEFIAYVTGHEHIDWIGVVRETANRQLMLNVTCGIGLCGTDDPFFANLSDLPRGGVGSTQDSFNLYGIDRVNKTVRIARVGSNRSSEGTDRKFLIIPYADN